MEPSLQRVEAMVLSKFGMPLHYLPRIVDTLSMDSIKAVAPKVKVAWQVRAVPEKKVTCRIRVQPKKFMT